MTEPKEIKINKEDISKYFPTNKTHDFRLTDVALYSTTPVDQAKYTANLLKSYYDDLKQKTLTDASACIGGNTWAFAESVKEVNAVELFPLHMECLQHNMKALELKNITYHTSDYTKLINLDDKHIKQDILFLDPPWGGKDYRDNVLLKYGDRSLEDLINSELAYQAELIMCKVPNNTSEQCIQKIKESPFPYYEELTIRTPDGKPIYKIIIISHIKKKRDLPVKTFPKLGYRGIKFTTI